MDNSAASDDIVMIEQDHSTATGLTTQEAERRLQQYGRNELVEKNKSKLRLLLEQFTGPLPIGIWIAIIVELCLWNIVDVFVLLSLQIINGLVGFTEHNKSNNAIAALKDNLMPVADVCRDGIWKRIDAALLVPGDLITLSSGSAVPADCRITSGSVAVDQSSLTGESLPVRMREGDEPKMGSTATRGEANAIVEATGMNTSYGNTASMIQMGGNASSNALDRLLLRIVAILLLISVLFCSITLIYMLASKEPVKSALSFNIVILVSSIPIAIEVVVTATLALGSRELTSHSAIVSNLNSIERLAGMSVLCSDKTGTLTLNEMMLQETCLSFVQGINRHILLLHSALVTRWREPAKDAIDTMILKAAPLDECDEYIQNSFTPFDSETKRTEAVCTSKTGDRFKIVKGAPDAVLELCSNKEEIRADYVKAVDENAERGIRSLAIAKSIGSESDLKMIGLLTFLDPPRADAKQTIALANEYGVSIKMITGDHQNVAKNTAEALCLGSADIIPCTLPEIDISEPIPDDLGDQYGSMIEDSDGMSCALPGQKFVMFEALMQRGHIVGMTGDGVNDAPALKHAHCGIAVVAATDAARASADIVLTTPGLSAIVEAILIARRIHSKMKSFLIYRIAATLQLLFFFFIAIMFIHPNSYAPDYPKFWSMPIIGLICITVLNDGTIISIAYDSVRASRVPVRWDLKELWITSSCLGSIACMSSLVLLHITLNMQGFGYESLPFAQVVTIMFLKVAISDFLTLFSARTGTDLCIAFRPSWHVVLAALIALGSSSVIALTWPFPSEPTESGGQSITFIMCMLVWAYCIVVFVVQDVTKALLFKVLYKFGIFETPHQNVPSLTSISTKYNDDYDEY